MITCIILARIIGSNLLIMMKMNVSMTRYYLCGTMMRWSVRVIIVTLGLSIYKKILTYIGIKFTFFHNKSSLLFLSYNRSGEYGVLDQVLKHELSNFTYSKVRIVEMLNLLGLERGPPPCDIGHVTSSWLSTSIIKKQCLGLNGALSSCHHQDPMARNMSMGSSSPK